MSQTNVEYSRLDEDSRYLSDPTSPQYRKWLDTLPGFLQGIVLDDLRTEKPEIYGRFFKEVSVDTPG